jgi:glycosyltransferase involved in cell wall biosynthesis
MKVFYLSSTAFLIFDIDLLTQLAHEHEITYGILIPKKDVTNSINEIDQWKQRKTNIKFFITNLKFRRRYPLNIPKYIKLIFKIRDGNFDIIFINDFEDIFLRLLLIVFIPKSKTVYGLHDVILHSGWRNNFLLNFSKRLFLKKFNTILTFSKSQGDLIRSASNKVYTIPLVPMNLGPKLPAPTTSINYKIIQFLFFGHILPYKGVDLIISAANSLSKKYSNFSLLIAGNCSVWENDYKPLIESSSHIETDIRFIDNNEIPQLFSKAHYLMLPYKDVTQSGPLMIAYYYNVPAIASRLHGFDEFIEEGKTGFTFDVSNPSDLLKVLEEAILRTKNEYDILKYNLDIASNKFKVENIAIQYTEMFNEINRIRQHNT